MKYYLSWMQWKDFVKVDNVKSREINDKTLLQYQ